MWCISNQRSYIYRESLCACKHKIFQPLFQHTRLSDSLGSGQFGKVMKGVWLLSGGSKEVAVKMLKKEASETEKVRFLQEAAINGQFWHPNVVKLMGVVTIGEPVSKMSNTSL